MTTPRRALGLVVATALAWGTACGSGDHHHHADPPPSPTSGPAARAPRTVGSPTTLPWWSSGRLHVEGGVIRTTMRRIVARGGTTIVGRATQHGSTWLILRGDRLVPLLSTHELGVEPVLSANGLHVAWTTSRTLHRYDRYTSDRAFTVTAYDVQPGRRVGTTVVESRVTCCDAGGVIEVAGVDNDGTVLLDRLYDRLLAWRPGHEAVLATGALHPHAVTGNDPWPGGVSWSTTGDSGGPAAFGPVDASGSTTRVGRVPQGQGGIWGPHGAAYVYQPVTKIGDPLPVVWWADRRVRLRVHHVETLVGWESARSVVVRTGHRPTVLFRCDARTGRCEQAGPARPRVVLPRTAG